MVSMLKSFLLLFFALVTAECGPRRKRNWGLNKGWSWGNWYYYWYWRHGMRALASDKDTICQQLWNVDVNRLHRGVEFDILPQINVSQRSNEDKAGNRLIYYLKWELMRRRPTFRTFTDLLSSFKPSPEGSSSQVRDLMQARDNIQNFLTEVLKTRVFNELFWFLVRNKYIPPNKAKFGQGIFDIWFNGKNTSQRSLSAFQKVFVGETVFNPRKISFRNWIQFYSLELKISLNYYGYVRFWKNDPMIISPMFSWRRGTAVSDNIFVGTSPEFELALYTLCFYLNPDTECECKLNTRRIMVKTITSVDGSTLRNGSFEIKT